MGTGLSRGAIVVANVLVARRVSQADFGALGVIQNTVTMLGVLAGFGLGMAATKFVAERKASRVGSVGAVLGVCHSAALLLGGALALVQLVFAGFIAEHVFGDARLAPLLRVSAGLVALSAINSVQISAVIGFETFRALAKLGAFSGVVTLGAIVALTVHFGVTGAIVGLTIAQAVTVVATHLWLKRLTRRVDHATSWRFPSSDLKILHAFGIPAVLSSVTFALADWAAPAIVVRQPHGLDQMALFGAANQWMALIVFLPVVIGRTWMPAMCASLILEDQGQTRRLLYRAIVITMLVTTPLLAVLSVRASSVMGLYGSAYVEGGQLLILVLLTGAVMALVKPADYLVHAAGAVWYNLGAVALYAGTYVVGTALARAHGVNGLVTSRLAGVVLYGVCLVVLAQKVLSERQNQTVVTG